MKLLVFHYLLCIQPTYLLGFTLTHEALSITPYKDNPSMLVHPTADLVLKEKSLSHFYEFSKLGDVV